MIYREETRTSNIHLLNEQILQNAPSVFAAQPFHEVSNQYGFVPTIQVIDALRSEGWYPVDATQKNVRIKEKQDFTKHLIRFRRLNDEIVINDNIVELLLTNSHDRSAAFVLHAGIFRMACANGIVIADSTFQKLSIRHNKHAVGRVIEGSCSIIENVPLITDQVSSMQAIELSRPEQEILADTALDYILPESEELVTPRANLIAQALRPKRSADTGSDLWSTFNVIQEKALRGGLRIQKLSEKTGYRRSSTRKVTSIDKNIKLNKALWSMAAKMQELKS